MSLSDEGIFDDETPRCFYWEEDIKKYIGGFLKELKEGKTQKVVTPKKLFSTDLNSKKN